MDLSNIPKAEKDDLLCHMTSGQGHCGWMDRPGVYHCRNWWSLLHSKLVFFICTITCWLCLTITCRLMESLRFKTRTIKLGWLLIKTSVVTYCVSPYDKCRTVSKLSPGGFSFFLKKNLVEWFQIWNFQFETGTMTSATSWESDVMFKSP